MPDLKNIVNQRKYDKEVLKEKILERKRKLSTSKN
jgi:hypothetical protein